MTNKTEEKWEKLDSLDSIKVGDYIEFSRGDDHRSFRYWGRVLKSDHAMGQDGYLMEGDWYIYPSSLDPTQGKNLSLMRKVETFEWPDYIGACVESSLNGVTGHYVRVAESGHAQWVRAETGEYFATWELELTCEGTDLCVLGRGY